MITSKEITMLTISLDKKPLEQLENDLDKFGKNALPYAVRNTLNTLAYEASKEAKDEVGRQFTERNKFTRNSIRFRKTFARNIDAMESSIGSTQEYMRSQEEGFTIHKKGKHGVPIPTSAAAGQMGASKRTKRLQRKNWMSQINLTKRVATGRGATIAAVRRAVKSGKRVVFIDSKNDLWGRPTGLYRIIGGRTKDRGWPRGAKLRMIYDMERTSAHTRAHHWLRPAVDKTIPKAGEIYRDEIIKQIERQQLFRSR
jgi:hypothetical protein